MLIDAVAATRKDIHKGMGYSIIKAGTSEFSPYPDVVLNAVMITFGEYQISNSKES